MRTTNSEERKSAFRPAGGPDRQSFLLDPSFLNSLLPLEKKPFFFLPCEEQSVCVGLPAGRGEGEEEEELTAGLTAEAGAACASDVSSLGSGSLCLFGCICEGEVSSRAAGPASWSFAGDVWES